MDKIVLQYGITNIIKAMIVECRKRHKHYAPTISTYSVWADVLEKYLIIMQDEVVDRLMSGYNK